MERRIIAGMMEYPFRILAAVLVILIGIEIIGIICMPDYSDELEAARQDYIRAYARNIELRKELESIYKED